MNFVMLNSDTFKVPIPRVLYNTRHSVTIFVYEITISGLGNKSDPWILYTIDVNHVTWSLMLFPVITWPINGESRLLKNVKLNGHYKVLNLKFIYQPFSKAQFH